MRGEAVGRRSRRSLHFSACTAPFAIQSITLFVSLRHLRRTRKRTSAEPSPTFLSDLKRVLGTLEHREARETAPGTFLLLLRHARPRKRGFTERRGITCRVASAESLRNPFTFPVSRWRMSTAVKRSRCTVALVQRDFPRSPFAAESVQARVYPSRAAQSGEKTRMIGEKRSKPWRLTIPCC